jgi:hypothetical protein
VLLATDSLLKIDVEAELRKLAGAQLRAPEQLPAELLRLAMAGGASSANIELRSDVLRIEATGWKSPGRTLQALAVLFGTRDRLDEVHSSLLALEKDESLGWIALTTYPNIDLELIVDSEAGVHNLRLRQGGCELRSHAPPDPPVSTLTISGLGVDAKRALAHLRQACRFASLPITINERPPDPPFAGALDVAALSSGMRGAIALTRKAHAPRVWLTRHGVLAAHFTAARGPGIELVVEVGRELGSQATAADLRERGEADLRPAMQQLSQRLAWLAEERRSPSDRRRLAELALECSAAGGDSRQLSTLPLFDRRTEDGSLRPWSLLELRASVVEEGGSRHCLALHPDDDPKDFDLSAPVVVLDDRLRAALAKQLRIDFGPPPAQESGESSLARLGRRWRNFWADSLEPLRRSRLARHRIAEEQLSAAEQAMLAALRGELPVGVQVELCRGNFEARASANALWLARDHPLVRAASNTCMHDPAWVYPAMLALAGSHVDSARARRRWIGRTPIAPNTPRPSR